VEQVSASAAFARDVAEATGYVPESIMAAPIEHDGQCLGVLEVLDARGQGDGQFGSLELLCALAGHTALLVRAGQPAPAVTRVQDETALAASRLLSRCDRPAQEAARELLRSLAIIAGCGEE
jgi:hypothetical protein